MQLVLGNIYFSYFRVRFIRAISRMHTSSISHRQHNDGISLVLENYSFLPHVCVLCLINCWLVFSYSSLPFMFLQTKNSTTFNISISVINLSVSSLSVASSFCFLFNFKRFSNFSGSLGAFRRVLICNSKCVLVAGFVPLHGTPFISYYCCLLLSFFDLPQSFFVWLLL